MSPTEVTIVELTGYRLPQDGELRRDYTRPPDRRSDYYVQAYDDRTVFYDCVYLQEAGGYLFTAPRFLNLWKPFRDGLRLDGKPVGRMRRVTWLRCEQVFLKAPKGVLALEIAGETVQIDVRPGLAEDFRGLDTLVAVSKNNRLEWIGNWARFHGRDHGAEGLVIFDNGSTDYDLQQMADVLRTRSGMKRAVIFSAPYPYGPADKSGRFDVSPRFFQTAMLNLARRDPFDQARAVLSIDIDELVLAPAGKSVFDHAARSLLGMSTIQGAWVYPERDTDGPMAQPAHVFRADPDKRCNRKWCMTPRGAMSRVFGWAVHHIGGILQDMFTNQDDFRLIHCRACSTGWKKNRFRFPDQMRKDPALVELMSRHFPDA